MAKKPPRPPRVALQITDALQRRIDAAHVRIRSQLGRGTANLSDTLRALLEAGLERDEANAKDEAAR